MTLIDRILPELSFSTSRASGPGGQNVNKVETRVTLRWDVANSNLISPHQKELLLQRLHIRLTDEGVLVLNSQETRSQRMNRDAVLRKFEILLQKALHKPTLRKPTQATRASKKKRLQAKKAHGEKKKWRQRPDA